MGNRCVIANKDKNIGVYLHWDGYREFVESALAYCDVKGYRSPDVDYEYGWARFCQVLGNTIGGTLSLGVGTYPTMDTDNWDNGTYIIKGWDIDQRLYQHYQDDKMKNTIFENFKEINSKQPENERLPDDELEKYAEVWEEKHLDRLKTERRQIVEERIKIKEKLEKAQKESIIKQEKKEQDSTNEKQDVEKNDTKEKQNSTLFDKNGKDSTEVNEPVIQYSTLKKAGKTIYLKGGDERGR